jgi:hypothetical protein
MRRGRRPAQRFTPALISCAPAPIIASVYAVRADPRTRPSFRESAAPLIGWALVSRQVGLFLSEERSASITGQMVRSWPLPPLRVYYQRLARATSPRDGQSHAKTALLQGQDQLTEAANFEFSLIVFSEADEARMASRCLGSGRASGDQAVPSHSLPDRDRAFGTGRAIRARVDWYCRGLVVLAMGSQGCSRNLLEGMDGHHSLCSRWRNRSSKARRRTFSSPARSQTVWTASSSSAIRFCHSTREAFTTLLHSCFGWLHPARLDSPEAPETSSEMSPDCTS